MNGDGDGAKRMATKHIYRESSGRDSSGHKVVKLPRKDAFAVGIELERNTNHVVSDTLSVIVKTKRLVSLHPL